MAARAAAALGIPFAPHHAGGAIKAAAALHLAAALPGFEIMECSLLRTALHDELTSEPVAHPAGSSTRTACYRFRKALVSASRPIVRR